MRTDIVIVGGGIIGLAIAHRLLGRGRSVCVIDAGEPGGSTTHAAAGMLCPGFELPHIAETSQAAFHDFAMASLNAWAALRDTLEKETGDDIDLRSDGALGLAAHGEREVVLKRLSERLAKLERPVRWLERREIEALQPGLSGHYQAAMFLPDEGQLDPRKAAAALVRAIETRGGRIVAGDPVNGIEPEGGRIRSVTTASGLRISAGDVILSAGLSVRDLWVEPWPLPMFSIKGQALSLSAPEAHQLRPVVRTGDTYICPKAGGRIVVGATEEEHVETLATDETHIRALQERAACVAPVLRGAALEEQWAGLRPTLPDRLPVIGRSRTVENLVYAFGHHRNGILLAPQTAALVERILDGGPELTLMAPDRFRSR